MSLRHTRNPAELEARYRSGGESLRQIAGSIGRSEYWLRCQLHRALGSTRYRRLVLHVLLKRIARACGKAFKHALYVLYMVRPVSIGASPSAP
jgi:hypothetical protein